MVAAQHNGNSTGADATAGFPQRATFQWHRGHHRQRNVTSSCEGRGCARQPLRDPWRGLSLRPVLNAGMPGAAQSTAPAPGADSTSGSGSRQQPEHVKRTLRQLAASDAVSLARQVDFGGGMQGRRQVVTAVQLSSLRLTAALAQYPRGSRVLHAANRDFLLMPLSEVVDQSYTAYFDMVSRRFPPCSTGVGTCRRQPSCGDAVRAALDNFPIISTNQCSRGN